MKVLVTGGAGYIGSHTSVQLLKLGYEVVVIDNLANSKAGVITRINKLSGKIAKFYKVDLLNREELDKVMSIEKPTAVIHFAGLKAVGESVSIPLTYYNNNIVSTLNLLQSMEKYKVNNLVFSSSATVYGTPKTVPIKEDFPLSATNPYGMTKLIIENILRDVSYANKTLNIAILRYFNPIGAHISGQIGEDPKGIPNNLLPFITQVAIGKLKSLSIYGNDYDTVDGTGVRDYIHVEDLARGHINTLQKIIEGGGLITYNLGTGKGYSVLEVVKAFEKASGITISYTIAPRRSGDIAVCYADPTKALTELNWEAQYGIDRMCEDSWRWQQNNPNGYED